MTVLTPLELVYKSLVIDTQLVKDGGSGGTVVFSSQNIDNKGTIDLGGGKNGYSTRIIPQQLKGFLLTMASSLIPGRPALLRS